MANHDRNLGSIGTSRRRFLQQIGLGSGAIGLAVFGGVIRPQTALAVCEPPGTPGTPVAWRRDCRLIRPRRPASTLTGAEIDKLKSAYQAMRALDVSDPTDPRGFLQQAYIHCWFCGEGTQVHGSWQFFVFHRAYLYFHERILGQLIGDMEFRLPYWDWETPSHRRIPEPYTTANGTSNPLSNSTRLMSPTDEIPDEDVGEAVMEAALTAGTFEEFGGTASDNGIPELSPHGSVHVDVGGDMGVFETAARDPIFYAHHSNVDKIWSDWNKASSLNTNPTDLSFLSLSWNFYDENKIWRSITAAQMLNHENQLRYSYGPSKWLEVLPCLLDWFVIRTDWSRTQTLKFSPETVKKSIQTLERGGRMRLHIRELDLPYHKSAVYRLYSNAEAAKANQGPGSDYYLGTIPVVLNDREKRHRNEKGGNVTINISARIAQNLLRPVVPLQLYLVERGTKNEAHKTIPVRAKDVYFSVAEVEK